MESIVQSVMPTGTKKMPMCCAMALDLVQVFLVSNSCSSVLHGSLGSEF